MENVTLIITIVFLAIITEYLTDMIKHLIPYETDYPFPLIIAMVVGIGLSVLTGADFLSAVGFTPKHDLIAQIITGLVVSGGSTAIHELTAKLRASREDI